MLSLSKHGVGFFNGLIDLTLAAGLRKPRRTNHATL